MSLLLAASADGDAARRQAWLEKRRRHVTSTDIPVLYGCGYAGSSVSKLFADKKGLLPEFEPNDRMEMGRLMQPVIASLYEQRTGLKVVNADSYTLFVSEEHPWLATSLDAFDSNGDILEIKNTGDYVAEDDISTVNTAWIQQTQVQQVVMKKRVRLVILSQGCHLRIYDVPLNESFVQDFLRRGKAFYDAVQAGVCPPPSSAEDNDAMKYLFQAPTGDSVALDETFGALVDERKGLKLDIKAAEERVAVIEAQIKFALGNATVGYLEGGSRVTWKPNKNGVRSLRID